MSALLGAPDNGLVNVLAAAGVCVVLAAPFYVPAFVAKICELLDRRAERRTPGSDDDGGQR